MLRKVQLARLLLDGPRDRHIQAPRVEMLAEVTDHVQTLFFEGVAPKDDQEPIGNNVKQIDIVASVLLRVPAPFHDRLEHDQGILHDLVVVFEQSLKDQIAEIVQDLFANLRVCAGDDQRTHPLEAYAADDRGILSLVQGRLKLVEQLVDGQVAAEILGQREHPAIVFLCHARDRLMLVVEALQGALHQFLKHADPLFLVRLASLAWSTGVQIDILVQPHQRRQPGVRVGTDIAMLHHDAGRVRHDLHARLRRGAANCERLQQVLQALVGVVADVAGLVSQHAKETFQIQREVLHNIYFLHVHQQLDPCQDQLPHVGVLELRALGDQGDETLRPQLFRMERRNVLHQPVQDIRPSPDLVVHIGMQLAEPFENLFKVYEDLIVHGL
mmetsp:Transcript_1882/g.5629  ORF Transcript_1882/g.5629 Transcript_1882/m.5629 type:complete len:385 (-) Transcript_1882:317-1471(-)